MARFLLRAQFSWSAEDENGRQHACCTSCPCALKNNTQQLVSANHLVNSRQAIRSHVIRRSFQHSGIAESTKNPAKTAEYNLELSGTSKTNGVIRKVVTLFSHALAGLNAVTRWSGPVSSLSPHLFPFVSPLVSSRACWAGYCHEMVCFGQLFVSTRWFRSVVWLGWLFVSPLVSICFPTCFLTRRLLGPANLVGSFVSCSEARERLRWPWLD